MTKSPPVLSSPLPPFTSPRLCALILLGCASLRALPASLTALAELERLVVTRCTALQWAPGNVAHMQGLRELRPDGCRTVLLPSSLVCLGRLDRLIVMGEVGEGMGMAMGDINGSMDGGGSTSSGCVTTMEGAADRCSTRVSGTIDGAAMVADTLSKGGSSKGSAAAAAASKAAAGGGGGGGGERGAAGKPQSIPARNNTKGGTMADSSSNISSGDSSNHGGNCISTSTSSS
ncbi:unnamed protein product [Closterium sp. NIES-53]